MTTTITTPFRSTGTPRWTARRGALIAAAGAAGLALALAAPLAASAHVTIDPATAAPGGYTVLTVKVPNESATAQTGTVELRLPTDTPFTSVRYVPVPGWTAELVRETLPEPVEVGGTEIDEAVTSVIWTASPGSEIGEGQLQQFDLSVGPVPDVDELRMPAIQTYTDGEIVEWTDADPEAELPAPVLTVAGEAADDAHDAHGDTPADGTAEAGSPQQTAVTAGPDVLARVLGLVGLAAGAAALVVALVRRRSA